MNTVINFIKRRIIKPIESTYLCIKYPFLYPRNRFTGRHYDNWKIHDYHAKNYTKCVKSVHVCLYNLKDYKKDSISLSLALDGYYYQIIDGVIKIFYKRRLIEDISIYDITEVYSSIVKIGFYSSGKNTDFHIVFDDDTTLGGRHLLFINHVVDRWLYTKIKFFDFINDYILQVLHCIPTYTELDAMKSDCYGWYKRFGKQLLIDMKKQLKKDKMLYSFRITQIKEKWGSFRLYCNCASKEMYDLIEKYSSMSEGICIDCGKDADIITDGYVCPYCLDCYNKNHSYMRIGYRKNKNGEFIGI